MNRYVRISEFLWLFLAFTCLCFSIYEFVILKNNEHGFYAIGFTFISAMMWALRRNFRKRMEKQRDEEGNGSK
ncbi:MAG: hypothetical protein FD123_2677 [Bacteroidetes bacterium]|nr:MAG: hypothetical protein FD123_2677 [Bacteroidota bacterium]